MTEYEDFLISLYYAKLEWMVMKSGNVPIPWNSVIQRDIDALADFSFFEVETHNLNKQLELIMI